MPATNELLQEGRYRINQQMPLNGHANVYEAYDTVRNANVVVKEIVVQLNRVTTISQQETMKTAFADQAKILAGIQHDSLLHVHDYFSEIGRQFLVMESIDGDDLADLLERNKSAFAVSDVVEWADQLLDALNYLHTFQPPIIHRNIRPQHIKLSSSGRIKLLAFSLDENGGTRLSTTLKDESSDAAINYSPLEMIWDNLDAASQKVVLGDYDDRSEKILKSAPDPRSDIYSLGATLYHLLTGRVPVDPLERSIEMLDGNPDPLMPPHKVNATVPVELSELLMRSLEIKRENRFDSAVIMRQVVRTAMVRVRERETEENLEHKEAAEDLRTIEDARHADSKKAAAEAELRLKQEQEEQKRAADERRLIAEQRAAEEKQAAEAERAAREKEEAAAKLALDERARAEKAAADKAAAEKIQQAKSEAERAKNEAAARAQAESDAVLRELKQELLNIEKSADPNLDSEVVVVEAEEVLNAEIISDESEAAAAMAGSAEVLAYDQATSAAYSRAVPDEIELKGIFAEDHSEAKSALPIPMIAGAAAVLLVIVIGAYFMLSGGSSTPESVAQQPAPTAQAPAETTPQTPTEPVIESSRETLATVQSQPAEVSDSQSAKRAAEQQAAAKARKAAQDAAKTADKKKTVTVDDLINDN